MKYLDSLNKYGSVPGLDSVRRLLDSLGNPEDATGFIHIAGTNGKGSVGTFITNILVKTGLKVGRFLSPAVQCPNEIIRIGNENITDAELESYFPIMEEACNFLVEKGFPHPTRFEVETAIAFMYFRDKKCDIAVVECGMGGLMDSTNILKNTILSVITPVGMDHMSFLGNTLQEIAEQKAGIIKAKRPVLAYYDSATIDVFVEKAKELEAELYITDGALCEAHDGCFDYRNWQNIKSGLVGEYQIRNAAMALDAVDILRKNGFDIDDTAVYEGIAEAKWFGRFQYLSHNPDFIIDGAHNPHAARALTDSYKAIYGSQTCIIVMGVFADKDYAGILDCFSEIAGYFVAMETPDNPRALSSKKLAEYIKTYYDISVMDSDNIADAVAKAVKLSNGEIPIVVCGSLSHLAMVEDCYNGQR